MNDTVKWSQLSDTTWSGKVGRRVGYTITTRLNVIGGQRYFHIRRGNIEGQHFGSAPTLEGAQNMAEDDLIIQLRKS